jgi:hypothetical protein
VTTNPEPLRVTIVAKPIKEARDDLIDGIVDTLKKRGVVPFHAASVRDIDFKILDKIVEKNPERLLSVQVIGHAISGQLYLGAHWMTQDERTEKAKKPPFFLLDTDPEALGLLARYAGHLADITLVGCNVGSVSAFGYAINGRTLTYTLAELLRCTTRGADDQVTPDEFDDHGVYSPSTIHRKPTGWRWRESHPPEWLPGTPGVTPPQDHAARELQIIEVTNTVLPVQNRHWPRKLPDPITIDARRIRDPLYEPRFAVPEVTVTLRDGHGSHVGELLDGGRYVKIGREFYTIDQRDQVSKQISKQLTSVLWRPDRNSPRDLETD